MTRLTLNRSGRFLSTAAVALALVGAGTTAAHATTGSGTAEDPWQPAKTARITCVDATRWGNYDEGTYNLRSYMDQVKQGDHIQVRYETHDRYAVSAKYSPADTKWGLILRSCVQFY